MDISLFNFFYSFANRSPLFDGLIVFFASYLPYLLIFAFCVLPYTVFSGWKKRLFLFLGLALSGILSRGIIVPSIRFLNHRARPFEIFGFEPLITPSGFSFPSGHAALFFALSFFLFFFREKGGHIRPASLSYDRRIPRGFRRAFPGRYRRGHDSWLRFRPSRVLPPSVKSRVCLKRNLGESCFVELFPFFKKSVF